MVSLFLIVITNRFSSILGDSIALRLLVKVIQVVAILKRNELVLENAADIDVASDEVLFWP